MANSNINYRWITSLKEGRTPDGKFIQVVRLKPGDEVVVPIETGMSLEIFKVTPNKNGKNLHFKMEEPNSYLIHSYVVDLQSQKRKKVGYLCLAPKIKLFLSYEAALRNFKPEEKNSLLFFRIPPIPASLGTPGAAVQILNEPQKTAISKAGNAGRAVFQDGTNPLTFAQLDRLFEANGFKPLGAVGHCFPEAIAKMVKDLKRDDIEVYL